MYPFVDTSRVMRVCRRTFSSIVILFPSIVSFLLSLNSTLFPFSSPLWKSSFPHYDFLNLSTHFPNNNHVSCGTLSCMLCWSLDVSVITFPIPSESDSKDRGRLPFLSCHTRNQFRPSPFPSPSLHHWSHSYRRKSLRTRVTGSRPWDEGSSKGGVRVTSVLGWWVWTSFDRTLF